MEKLNRILKGVNQDLDPRYQPEDTLRDSVNGIIVPVGADSYAWRPVGKTEVLFTLQANEKIFGHCRIRERLILLTWSGPAGVTYFKEVLFDDDMNATVTILSQKAGNPLNLSYDHPIRVMIGFYEADDIQRIYFTDYNNQPRVVNIGSSTFVFNEKFADFFPVLEHVYGIFSVDAILSGGALPAGNYFFCWRYYTKDGYFTDWSYLSNPVTLTGENAVAGELYEYQRMGGQAPDYNTRKSIRVKLSNIDTDYDSIQVGAFYSNDLNSAQPGIVFFDSDISGSEMLIMYSGGENIDIILIDDLVNHSTVIEKCKEMRFVKKRNVLAVTKERDELNIENQLEVEIGYEMYEIPVDIVQQGKTGTETDKQALFAVPHVQTEKETGMIRAGVWYKVTGTTDLSWTDVASNPHTETLGTRFKPSLPGTYTPGSAIAIPIIRKKLYKLRSGVPADPTSLGSFRWTNTIVLSWKDNSFTETGFRIEYRAKGAGTWETDITVGPNTEMYVFNAPDSTVIWEFRVWAFNTNGDSVNPTNTIEQRSLPTLPAAPSGLSGTTNEVSQITLTWTDNSDNEEGFKLFYRIKNTLPQFFQAIITIPPNATLAVFHGGHLQPGHFFSFSTYEFYLQAYNEGGNSAASNIAEGRATQPAPTSAPSPFTVSQIGNCKAMHLVWGAVARASWYRIERQIEGGSWTLMQAAWTTTNINDIASVGEDGVFFYYRVRGENDAGVGPWAYAGETAICESGGERL